MGITRVHKLNQLGAFLRTERPKMKKQYLRIACRQVIDGLLAHWRQNNDKNSENAKMGDRLATLDMG